MLVAKNNVGKSRVRVRRTCEGSTFEVAIRFKPAVDSDAGKKRVGVGQAANQMGVRRT